MTIPDTTPAPADAVDILLDDGALPFGAPDFARITPDLFLPAFRTGIAETAAEISGIANDPQPPTFANTLEALERTGARLSRVRRIFWTLASTRSDADMRAVEPEVTRLLTRHGIAVAHDPRLFARVRALWDARDTLPLDEAQMRLLDASYRGFVDGGAALDPAAKARSAAIAEDLATLSIRFGQNVLAATADWSLTVDAAGVAGLPDTLRAGATLRAEAVGEPGRYTLGLDRGEVEAVLTFADDRRVRERVWRAFTTRCDGGAHDNWPIVERILTLRRERAALLGYANYADLALSDSMAKTPDAAMALLMRVWTPALAQARAEQEVLELVAADEVGDFAAWDWRYYAERVRRERYALDGAEVKRHLTLTRVRDAAFASAGRLYGLRFEARDELPGWHADVQAWGVTEADGTPLGLLYTDYFARADKRGGAWMGSLRVQERMDDAAVLPIAYLVANFAAPPPGADTGLSIDEARTLFHEFGHALHALLSDVVYPSQAGTAVARDFVEFPSKFMEHWIVARDTLATLGLPDALITAIGRAGDFGQGFATVEFLASAILDLALHRSDTAQADARTVTARTLADIGMPDSIAPRHGLTHFTHVFDGGYAASYYSYLWSEVLDADAFAAFTATGDLFDPVLAGRFRRDVLGPGNSRDPAASFLAFRGRDPDEHALLVDRRLAQADA